LIRGTSGHSTCLYIYFFSASTVPRNCYLLYRGISHSGILRITAPLLTSEA